MGGAEDGKGESGEGRISFRLGPYETLVREGLANLRRNGVVRRIWEGDHTVWKPGPEEISNRLGWLRTAAKMEAQREEIEAWSASVRGEGFTDALLLGMGGSSLAPEVFSRTWGAAPGFLRLAVLDSTDPDAVLGHARRLDLRRTLFIVSTKSGGTIEPLSFFKHFYNRLLVTLGPEEAGRRFVAITDPGSGMFDLAVRCRFRRAFLNDPEIGGRYSALSLFGLVPASLIGVNLKALLERAREAACEAGPGVGEEGDAARLGAALGELAKAGRDKATFVLSREISAFGDWVEQLIAESTGKEGRGILPVLGEPPGRPGSCGSDRFFIHLRMEGDATEDDALRQLEKRGHPVAVLRLRDREELGRQFFLWEMATAVAGHCLGINPFDQPDVEAAKVLARKMTQAYRETGRLPEMTPLLEEGGIRVYGGAAARTAGEALGRFLVLGGRGSYIALQAYLKPCGETDEALAALRTALGERTGMAVTVGYGPRFLHSTGQLHKGDAGRGLFIQFTADAEEDAEIPDEAGSPGSWLTFGVLKEAQALGDRQALIDGGRPVIRLHLGRDAAGRLRELAEAMR